jgi:hypothetical protein
MSTAYEVSQEKLFVALKRTMVRDPKHRRQLGELVWLLLYMFDIADWATGRIAGWKDQVASEENGIPLRTIRDQRQKLEKLDYITCKQGRHGQEIIIHKWVNPRSFSGVVLNIPGSPETFEYGDNKVSPSKRVRKNNGDTNGSSQGVTPTSDSQNHIKYNYADLSPKEAAEIPEIALYSRATGFFPGSLTWESVVDFIREHQITEDALTKVAAAWSLRGYRRENVIGQLEWARDGIPPLGKGRGNSQRKSSPTPPPPQNVDYESLRKQAAERLK